MLLLLLLSDPDVGRRRRWQEGRGSKGVFLVQGLAGIHNGLQLSD